MLVKAVNIKKLLVTLFTFAALVLVFGLFVRFQIFVVDVRCSA